MKSTIRHPWPLSARRREREKTAAKTRPPSPPRPRIERRGRQCADWVPLADCKHSCSSTSRAFTPRTVRTCGTWGYRTSKGALTVATTVQPERHTETRLFIASALGALSALQSAPPAVGAHGSLGRRAGREQPQIEAGPSYEPMAGIKPRKETICGSTLLARPALVGFGLLRGVLVGLLGALVSYLPAVAGRGCRFGFLLALAIVGRVEACAREGGGDRVEDSAHGGCAADLAGGRGRGAHAVDGLELVALWAAVPIAWHPLKAIGASGGRAVSRGACRNAAREVGVCWLVRERRLG
jgi:hypothetical protein